MKQNTKHKQVIIAWLNGADIQSLGNRGDWINLTELDEPLFSEDFEYRVKPQPVVTHKFVNVYINGGVGQTCPYINRKAADKYACSDDRTAVLISTYHDGELVSQELEKC